VHLAKWPEASAVDQVTIESMEETRNLVTAALEARVKCGIKVRQPIASVSGPKIPAALAEVVLDELNAKAYLIVDGPIAIDTTLTPELIAEGAVRELTRAVQGKRKQMNLEPQDVITLKVDTNDNGQEAISNFNELLVNTVGAKAVEFCAVQGEEIVSGNYRFKFEVNLG
jgi:isoleucyl-tRNA synthetase